MGYVVGHSALSPATVVWEKLTYRFAVILSDLIHQKSCYSEKSENGYTF